ncbi:MAG: hypothetical protein KME16_15720 [Scytolyngbya sp. HA4215-MV1]|jgi:hypothetical protein|nr:hypothetical protein [Scytolyngbya sp. HA4215-MV1]
MFEAILILVVGFVPALLSWWVMRRAEAQARASLRAAIHTTAIVPLRQMPHPLFASDQRYIEGMGYIIGDITCRFNARSCYVRCAVNPCGPCRDCSFYESIE